MVVQQTGDATRLRKTRHHNHLWSDGLILLPALFHRSNGWRGGTAVARAFTKLLQLFYGALTQAMEK